MNGYSSQFSELRKLFKIKDKKKRINSCRNQVTMFSQLLLSWFVVVFFISGLLINLVQLCVLPLYWIHRKLYHVLISKLCYCLYSEITFLAEWWSEIDLHVYGAKHDVEMMAKENWLAVSNHLSDIDWLIAWVFSERTGILGGTTCFIKDSVKYVPTVGWAYWFAEWGFLKRDWNKDEQRMINTLNTLKNDKPAYYMMLYCEGTRRTAAKIQASREYAQRNNIEPLEHHLLPRTKGFAFSVQQLRDNVPAVYDVEMAFPDVESATITNLLKRSKIEVHLHIRRIPAASVPCSSTEEASNYCMQLYRNKDQLMEQYVKTGKFPDREVQIRRGYSNLVTFAIHNIIVAFIFVYLAKLYGVVTVATIVLLLAISAFSLLELLNRVTQTGKGSKFGLKTKKAE
ncbi:1-acyl-sn-glycerol-3-phosphate acyltransferase delta-like isoform X2 [Hydractinia symbiolongicarpus]|uniref:1-acyl-sn-glycerol-3-phosphate acyltransferase delta-like isoform X2 n=1 Tax=Hydractinia symbiolongicarpus TaxID=13093 RepID=UPI0025511685|nr:1-acyl-sn-glycerol-3-phosphate acyltransferase delta-like isoform X2 [Hydractinia symbiolongicarpus]